MIKLRRGQKLCKNCGCINAARQRVCKDCSKEFISKNTPIKGEILNWKSLQKDDLVKIINGSGPYYICQRDTEDCQSGERIYMGDRGVYKVVSLKENGLSVFGAGRNNRSFSFLYMGDKYTTEDRIIMEPYRIKKVKRR